MTAIFPVTIGHPIIDGEWHIILHQVGAPQSGEKITTLCGITDSVEYQENTRQIDNAECCQDCQDQYGKIRYPRGWLFHAIKAEYPERAR